jgi:hypothetical protein
MSNKIETANNILELKDKHNENKIILNTEDDRKIIPKEVKNLNFVLKNYPSVTKYTWEVDGERVCIFILILVNAK